MPPANAGQKFGHRLNAVHKRRPVQRQQRQRVIDFCHNVIIDNHRTVEIFAAMSHTMPHGRQFGGIFQKTVGEIVQYGFYSVFMIRYRTFAGELISVIGADDNFGTGQPDTVDHTFARTR